MDPLAPGIDPDMPHLVDDALLDRACALLHEDQLCAFPTETVYGLGGNARSARAIERIYEVKGRPRHNPLIVHVPDEAAARACARDFPERARALGQAFWPGPLTLVVPRDPDQIPALVSAGLPTVALRVPAHPLALRLLARCGLPLAAPSANPSERLSPTRAEHVRRALPQVLVLDGGPCRLGIESTVVDLSVEPPRLLRPGALPLLALRRLLPDLQVLAAPPADGPLPSPGMMTRHYAPRARLVLVEDGGAPQVPWERLPPGPTGLLCRGEAELGALAGQGPPFARVEALPEDAAGYAADLYAALHRLDDAGVASIVVVAPPTSEDFAAVLDRLRRASAPP